MKKATEDILRMALENPDLRDRILEKSTGVIGEFLVERKIASLGYEVTRASNNRRQSDLVVKSPGRENFSVEVKVDRSRRPTWFVRKRPDPTASAYWIFGASILDPSAVEYFVLTVDEVLTLWDESDWNKRNPTNGDLRRWQIPDDALEAWHKFPTPMRRALPNPPRSALPDDVQRIELKWAWDCNSCGIKLPIGRQAYWSPKARGRVWCLMCFRDS